MSLGSKFIVILMGLLISVSGQNCSNPPARREWRQLSEGQRQAYIAAVRALKARSFDGDETSNMGTWNHDMFSEVHWKYQQNNHGKPAFLPWHRRYINGYEAALKSIDPSVSLPYWDWRVDSQNPGGSELLQAKYFGGNGDRANGNCVTTGIAAGWTSSTGPNQGNCLRRCNDWKILYSPESVAALLGVSIDYATFYASLEGGPHAAVHNQLGGSCGDFSSMASSNDPIFFLHHAMVDKLWWVWQQACSAFSQLGPGTSNYPPYGQINSYSTINNGLCYSYSESAGDKAPITMKCSSGQVNPWGGAPVSTSTTRGTGTATSGSSTPTATVVGAWLENAIMALVPVQSLAKVAKNSAIKMGSSMVLRKRQFPAANSTVLTDQDFCYKWKNIKCSVLAPDEYLAMMGLNEEQIQIVHNSHNQTCAAVKAINANPDRNSLAALESFQFYNPHWEPPEVC